MKTKTYDLVKQLLTEFPETRNSDKRLIWFVWQDLHFTEPGGDYIHIRDFLKAPSTESIRRSRQKIQELHPELRGSEKVRKMRKEIEAQRGTHVFREEVKEQGTLI